MVNASVTVQGSAHWMNCYLARSSSCISGKLFVIKIALKWRLSYLEICWFEASMFKSFSDILVLFTARLCSVCSSSWREKKSLLLLQNKKTLHCLRSSMHKHAASQTCCQEHMMCLLKLNLCLWRRWQSSHVVFGVHNVIHFYLKSVIERSCCVQSPTLWNYKNWIMFTCTNNVLLDYLLGDCLIS